VGIFGSVGLTVGAFGDLRAQNARVVGGEDGGHGSVQRVRRRGVVGRGEHRGQVTLCIGSQ
jgi:hypothetical protein